MAASKLNYFGLFLAIGIIIIAIIIGTLVYSTRENFSNDKKLVYLYMTGCGACRNFEPEWTKIEQKINSNFELYQYKAEKYDLNKDDTGKKYAEQYNITYAPAILFLSSSKLLGTYNEGDRSASLIINWACKLNGEGK